MLFGSKYHEEHRVERQRHAEEAAEASRLRAEVKGLRHLLRAMHGDSQLLYEDCDICDALRAGKDG